MDATQLTIIVISSALTVLFIILGIQVWFILREMRRSLEKMNAMLDDAKKVSGAVSEGVVEMSGFMNGIKTGISAITSILAKKTDHE